MIAGLLEARAATSATSWRASGVSFETQSQLQDFELIQNPLQKITAKSRRADAGCT
jgi:hypothetical protein